MRVRNSHGIRSVRRFLADLIRFATRCEEVILRSHQKRPRGAVAYATLVAQRRFAEAILTLGTPGAYEARVVLRTMVEHHFNLAWILLKEPHRRANRFMKFQAVERVRGLERFPKDMRPPEYDKVYRRALQARARVAHLFRRKRNGKFAWDKNWARGTSFETRLNEVLAAEAGPGGQADQFMYTLYRWFSGLSHGNASHFQELLEPTRFGVRAKANPDPRPANQMMSASLFLAGTLGKCEQVLGFSPGMSEKLSRLSQRCKALAQAEWGGAGQRP